MKWEYCQAYYYGNGEFVAIADKDEPIARAKNKIILFNQLGEDGWELVTVEAIGIKPPPEPGFHYTVRSVFIFKRPIEPTTPGAANA